MQSKEKKSKNILGPSVGYTDLINAATEEKLQLENKEKFEGKVSYHPLRPSAAGQCSRKLALDLMEYRGHAHYEREVLQPNIYRLFNLGHAVEYQVLKDLTLLKDFKQRYKQQVLTFFELERGTKDLPVDLVEGSCDFVLWSEEHKAIGDVKSKKDGWSAAFKTQWEEDLDKYSKMRSLQKLSPTSFYADNLGAFIDELGDTFMVDNLYQLNLYANSEFIKQRGIDHAFLLYYNKNSSELAEIRFRPCPEVFEYVKDKFNTVSRLVDQQKLPEKCDFMVGTIRHAFCECNKIMPPAHDPMKEWFSTMPPKSWPKDLNRIKFGDSIQELFNNYEKLNAGSKDLNKIEIEICNLLADQKINKVKLDNGNVYELKWLKSPRPHYELRRSKL